MKKIRSLLIKEAITINNSTNDLELKNDSALLILICETKTDPELAKWLNDNTLIVYKCLSNNRRLNYIELIKEKLK